MYNKILKLRPSIDVESFELQDNSDGKGPFIASWTSSETQPTDAEIASVDDSKATWIQAQEELLRLEKLETPRRLAEATLTAEGKAWLQSNRDAIAIERGKL